MASTNDSQEENWRGINVNVGLLVALAALFCTAFLAGLGVPAWVDDRVDDRVDTSLKPLVQTVERHEAEIEALRLRLKREENR